MDQVINRRIILGIFLLVFGIGGYTLTKTMHQAPPSVGEAVQAEVPAAEIEKTPHVEIINEEGQNIGTVVLKQDAKGVALHIQVSKLSPGKHGIHIHEAAFADTDFETAGAHLNPYHKHHGLENPKGPHLGDMPNLDVKSDGTAEATFFLSNATLEKGKENSLSGRSIIIHEKEDDQKSDPAGNSGERIAGGVIPE
ncbi:MAG TPA: superoxide dismutase family protein [Bacillota bacterium]|nr:superoxide dismutase family protein [Bacillota bacterium]